MKEDQSKIDALTEQVSRLAAQVEVLTRSPTPKLQQELAAQRADEIWYACKAIAENPDVAERAKAVLALPQGQALRVFQFLSPKVAHETLAAIRKTADRERLRSYLAGGFLAEIDAVGLPAPARVKLRCADEQGFFESPKIPGVTKSDGYGGTRLMGDKYVGTSVGAAYKIMLRSQLDDLLKKDVVLADAIQRGIVKVEALSDEASHGLLIGEIRAMREER